MLPLVKRFLVVQFVEKHETVVRTSAHLLADMKETAHHARRLLNSRATVGSTWSKSCAPQQCVTFPTATCAPSPVMRFVERSSQPATVSARKSVILDHVANAHAFHRVSSTAFVARRHSQTSSRSHANHVMIQFQRAARSTVPQCHVMCTSAHAPATPMTVESA